MWNPYYSAAENLSKIYALNLVLEVLYWNDFNTFNIINHVGVYGPPIRNGCNGDDNGSLYCHWYDMSSTFGLLFKEENS